MNIVGVKGMAAILDLTDGQVYRMAKKIPHMRCGKYYRFDVDEVIEYLRHNPDLKEQGAEQND